MVYERTRRMLLLGPGHHDRDWRCPSLQERSHEFRVSSPVTQFNRLAVTREINDGLLAPRFAPSQRAWLLSGTLTPVSPAVEASIPQDADNR
jgi:hypothetical protein